MINNQLSEEEKRKIAVESIIWLKTPSQIADEMHIRYVYVLNYTKCREYKFYEQKWLLKKAKVEHKDLFDDTKTIRIKLDKLLDF